MDLEIREGDFDAFFDAPFNACDADSPYVSPLKGELKRFVAQGNPMVSRAGEGKDLFHRPSGRTCHRAHHGP